MPLSGNVLWILEILILTLNCVLRDRSGQCSRVIIVVFVSSTGGAISC